MIKLHRFCRAKSFRDLKTIITANRIFSRLPAQLIEIWSAWEIKAVICADSGKHDFEAFAKNTCVKQVFEGCFRLSACFRRHFLWRLWLVCFLLTLVDFNTKTVNFYSKVLSLLNYFELIVSYIQLM